MDEAPLWFQAYHAQIVVRLNNLEDGLAVHHNELAIRLNNIENGLATTYNRMVQRSHEAIKPLIGVNGKVPPNFPATKKDLCQLSEAQYILLLQAYNLDVGGTVVARRNRLAVHIGLIL